MEKVLVILNPSSGLKQGKKHLADILEILSLAGFESTVRFTSYSGHAKEIAKLRATDFDKIVCIGGDGTLSEVVSGILESGVKIPIGYIPAGSTNDFANSLNIPKNMLSAARRIVEGECRDIDVGAFNNRYFCYVASFGIFTKTSYTTPQNVKNALGHLAYILEGVKELGAIKPEHLKFTIGDETFEDDYIFGAVCNSTSVGGIVTLSSDVVDMNDGVLELLLVKMPQNLIEVNECIAAISSQKYDSKMITFKSVSEVTISSSKDTQWTIDGEQGPISEVIDVKNIHNAIKIIL